MAYKRPESSYYYVRRKNLPGFGDTGAISSRSKSKRVAERMERLLEELAERALVEPKWRELLEAVVDRELSLPDLLRSKSERRLPALLRSLHDPPLEEVVESFRPTLNDRNVGYGLDKLLELAPDAARLSYLQDAKTVTDLCVRCEEVYEIKRTSVHRQLLRGISLLLRHECGNHERDRIFADVQYERPDDTRDVHLTPAQIEALLQACEEYGYDELQTLIRTALLTSADRGVLLSGKRGTSGSERGLLVRDVQIYEEDGTYSGQVHLPDGKEKSRRRTVSFGDRLARELLLLAQGKEPSDPIFSIEYQDLDYPWQNVREAAGLEHVRFKDLRAQTAIYAQRAGIPQAVIQSVMGHRSAEMTRRYQRHEAAMTKSQAGALEPAMFRRKTG